MKISVVTAVYNRASTIGDALQSVLSQTHQDLEYIIQDGGSTDGTLAEIERLNDPRIRLVSAPDTGIYDAINKGIERATGDVVGLVHSDDFLAHPRVLENIAATIAKHQADGAYSDLDYISASDPEKVVRHWVAGTYDPKKLARGWMLPHPTLYLKRSIFEAQGLYDTDFMIAADYEAILRYLTRGQVKLAYLPEVTVKMRVGGASNKSPGQILRKSREDLKAMRRHKVGGLPTLLMKNISKIPQLFAR